MRWGRLQHDTARQRFIDIADVRGQKYGDSKRFLTANRVNLVIQTDLKLSAKMNRTNFLGGELTEFMR